MSKPKIEWKKEPEDEDYDGARNFLTLICSDAEAAQLVARLRESGAVEHPPKDLLRAADLPLLDSIRPARQ